MGCSDCLDDRDCCECQCCGCDGETVKEWLAAKRNMFASIISGILFSMGWWFVIDSTVNYAQPIYSAFFICGIASTIAMVMINVMPTSRILGDQYDDEDRCFGKRAARAWMFVGFMLAFGGLIGSLWIFIQEFLVPEGTPTPPPNVNLTATPSPTSSPLPSASPAPSPDDIDPMHIWQGISFFLQNLFIFGSNLVFKFGRAEQTDDSW